MIMNSTSRASVVIILILILSLSSPVVAHEDGKFNSANGCSCHYNNSPSPTPTHDFPSSYEPNQVYSLSIGLSGGVSGSHGGFSLEVSQGTLSTGIGIGNVQINSSANQATHIFPDYRSWSLNWEAPSSGSGTVTFELSVLSANGNGANSGDSWGAISPFTSTENISINTPPQVNSLIFIPTEPTKLTGLSINYIFYDSDNDSESGTEIRWKMNGIDVSEIDDIVSIPNSYITKGDLWEVIISPSDGIDLGESISAGPVLIRNSAPSVSNLVISPDNPTDTDSMSLEYIYSDMDEDIEQGTAIHWYLDNIRQDEIDGTTSVSSLMIRYGDIWQVAITPSDGENPGQTVWSNQIIIGSPNNIPIVNVELLPNSPLTSNNLQASINSNDADGDMIQDTEILWFRDGIPISSFENLDFISSSSTIKGEIWNFSARVSDGVDWSDWGNSDTIIIQNSLPVVSSATILPVKIITTVDDFYASWEQHDADGDEESNSEIRWLVDGILMTEYNDMSHITSSSTQRGQFWSFQVTPGDGEDIGITFESQPILIDNSAPSISLIYLESGDAGWIGPSEEMPELNPNLIYSHSNLIVKIGYNDSDDNYVNISTQWSRNGFHVPDFDNMTLIPAERLEQDQSWSILVIATDPLGLYTNSYSSVVISNMPPEARITYYPESLTPGAMILFDSSESFDSDGSLVSWLWTIDGQEISGQTVNILLDNSQHVIQLIVIDNHGSSNIIQSLVSIGVISTIDSFTVTMDGAKANLDWSWDGDQTEFNIYRSTSPIVSVVGLTSIDETPSLGEPVPLKMTPVGITNDTSWSENVPIATTLYYAITTFSAGEEVVWIVNESNVASVNASSAASSISLESQESSPLSIILSIIFILVGLSSITFNIITWRNKI